MEWRWWLLFYCPCSVDPLSRLRDDGLAQEEVEIIVSEVDDKCVVCAGNTGDMLASVSHLLQEFSSRWT